MIAADWQQSDLRGVDFIGADLRDANLSGANLSTSLFLTQMQINSAKGNKKTRLPHHLDRHSHWTAYLYVRLYNRYINSLKEAQKLVKSELIFLFRFW